MKAGKSSASEIAIVGAGAFGTALAIVSARKRQKVILWARDADHAARLNSERRNAVHLPDCPLPEPVTATSDLQSCAAAELILIAVPAQATRAVARQLAPIIKRGAYIVGCAKGIEQETGALQSDILAAELPYRPLALLSGPGFASEIAAGRPTAMTLAGFSRQTADHVCARLAAPGFRPYSSTDVRGVELGGALKNVIAIACGVVAGRALGESARAALLTRGLAEMARLAGKIGAAPETLSGLSGLGDLVLTAMSAQSRNTRFGMALGEKGHIRDLVDSMPLAEGVYTAPVAARLGREQGVDMPITDAVASVLAGTSSVDEAIENLVQRPLRSEQGQRH